MKIMEKRRLNRKFRIILLLIIIILYIIIQIILKDKNIFLNNDKNYRSILHFKNNFPKIFYKKEKHVITYNPIEIIDNYLSPITSEFTKQKEVEKRQNEQIILLNNNSKYLFDKAKMNLSKLFSNKAKEKKNITTIMLTNTDFQKFGNKVIILNNLIYYCEILGFKTIYLSPSSNWFIKNKIVNDNINISTIDNNKEKCSDKNILCLALNNDEGTFLFYQAFIKPEIRINIIKDEIKRNLPELKINQNDLFIHIRSGDIFQYPFQPTYSQPPFCFYENILNNFKFNNIYIIAVDNSNPVINIILQKFKNVIFNINSLEVDIAYLVNAYNLVASVSSFFVSSIKFNDNLKNCWEYDLYHNIEKYRHLHYDFYEFNRNYKIYKMKPSENYKNKMFVMTNTPEQFKLMIEEKCKYDFVIIE